MMDLVFSQYIPSDIRAKAVAKVVEISTKLNLNPNALMVVMYKESRLNPKAQNPSSKATGLIQWLPSTARSVHSMTVEQIKNLSFLAQLELVYDYYNQPSLRKKRISDVFDTYFAVFHPPLIGQPDSTVFAKKGTAKYEQNSGLDVDKDGIITVENIKTWFKKGVPTTNFEIFVAKNIKYFWWITYAIIASGLLYWAFRSKFHIKILNFFRQW